MTKLCHAWLSIAIAGLLVCILLGCSASESESPAPSAKKMTPEDSRMDSSAEYQAADPPDDQPAKLTLNPPAMVEPIEVQNAQSPSVGSSYGTRGMRSPSLGGWNSSAAESSDFEPPATNNPGSSFPQSAAPDFAGNAPEVTSNAPNYSASPNYSPLPSSTANPPLPIEEPDSIQTPEVFQTPAKRATNGFTEVNVFYATDRNQVQISPASVVPLQAGIVATVIMLLSAVGFLVFNRLKSSVASAGLAGILFLVLCGMQNDAPNRDGFTFGSERGSFARGVATVSIPDSHQRGIVERPSIVRLEFVEDETKHVVLAKATELDRDQFYQQMTDKLIQSSEQDLLVFIHGFNVDFDSAVRRTAQIATDLSFEGVPVCYSWPSQGSLVGYTADENAVIWTVPHLRDFLLELADRSHARSINIIAHSMGNRAVTGALAEISRQVSPNHLPLFDQIVLAAPRR